MVIGSPKEIFKAEARVAMTPDSALQLQKLGYRCAVETGAGVLADFPDEAYRAAGVTVVESAEALYRTAEVIAKVRAPDAQEVSWLGSGKTLICLFYPPRRKSS